MPLPNAFHSNPSPSAKAKGPLSRLHLHATKYGSSAFADDDGNELEIAYLFSRDEISCNRSASHCASMVGDVIECFRVEKVQRTLE